MNKIFILLLLFISCFCSGQDYFPLQIGNVWVYERLDRPGYDIFKIIDTTVINGQKYYITQERYAPSPTCFETYYRKDSLDQVWYLFRIDGNENILYKLNVPVGTSWGNSYARVTLEDTSDIQYTPAGVFYNCYHYSTIYLPYYVIDTHRWLAPDIGLVHREDEGEGAILKGAYVNGVLYGDTTTTAVDIADDINSLKFELCQNYPNPFNPSTAIPFTLLEEAHVQISVYDITGRRVARLTDRIYQPGRHTVLFDGANVSSGIYFIRAEMVTVERKERHDFTRKVTVLK